MRYVLDSPGLWSCGLVAGTLVLTAFNCPPRHDGLRPTRVRIFTRPPSSATPADPGLRRASMTHAAVGTPLVRCDWRSRESEADTVRVVDRSLPIERHRPPSRRHKRGLDRCPPHPAAVRGTAFPSTWEHTPGRGLLCAPLRPALSAKPTRYYPVVAVQLALREGGMFVRIVRSQLPEDCEIASALHLALWESFIQRGARVRDAHRQRSYGALTPTLSQRAREWRM